LWHGCELNELNQTDRLRDVVLARSRQRETERRRGSDSEDGDELWAVACLVRPDRRRTERSRETDTVYYSANDLKAVN
jgi:hypothetical protein